LIPPDEEKFLVYAHGDIVMNGQTMNNLVGDYGIYVDSYEWQRSLPSPCKIEVKIKIFGAEAKNFIEKITMPDWLNSKVKIASVSCQDSQSEDSNLAESCNCERGIFRVHGYKEYFFDQDVIIKQSPVLAGMISSSQGQSKKKVVLTDTSCATFEAFLNFCKTGYIQMSAINEKMAAFVDTYKTENLRHVLDKHVSMILNADNLHTWLDISEKLELKNTALAISNLQQQVSETMLYEGTNKKFKDFTYKVQVTTDYPLYGKFQNLSHSENIMIN